jgi:hypothetical protein
MNYLILLGILGLFALGSKSAVGWVQSIKETLLKIMVPGADRRLFSGFKAATVSQAGVRTSDIGWTRNPASWVRSFDWTGYAAGIWGLGGVGGGTLITRRHVLFAQHVPYPARPFEIYFVTADSRTIPYQVTNIQQVGDTDIAIGTLDRDADASLCVYKVLPDNWTQYAKAQSSSFNVMGVTGTEISAVLPVLYSNQDRKVSTADLTHVRVGIADVSIPAFEVARAFGDQIRGGDSGNPIFVPVGNELVLLGAFYRLGSANVIASFPWIITYRGAIENIIGQKLQVVDLGRYA